MTKGRSVKEEQTGARKEQPIGVIRKKIAKREQRTTSDEVKPALHMAIRLLDIGARKPIQWGDVIPDGTAVAIAIHNPSDKFTRVVCHVCDKDERRLAIEGKLVMDLASKQSAVMLKFVAHHKDAAIQTHFLAANLPLVPGRPLYHTKLYLNVSKPKESS